MILKRKDFTLQLHLKKNFILFVIIFECQKEKNFRVTPTIVQSMNARKKKILNARKKKILG